MSKSARLRAQRKLQGLRVTQQQADEITDGKTWYRIKNLVDQPSTAAIYLYEEIGYWGCEASDFVRELMALRVDNIIVHINSPGGDVFDGLAIYHALRDHSATIEVRVDGLAASAASFIAMAGDRIIMQRNATMMIHDASGFCIGNAADMQKMVDVLDQASNNIADIYMQQAGGTVEAWRAAMREETWYTGAEALAAGLCDEVNNADEEAPAEESVVPGEDDEDIDALMAKSYDLTVFAYRHAGRDQAPAPKPVAELAETTEPEPAPEPAAVEPAPAAEPEQEPIDEPDPAETSEPAGVPAEPETPEPEVPAPAAAPTDDWASMFDALTQPNTFADDVFAALLK
ncbi:hypothetical protein DMC63_01315 [Streptomyces sp. WAC 05977]|nr:hypothetical protein DMC63_01315 [Streptomyces sp. WAC 05977]